MYPLLPFFRRFGIRIGREIQRERYALKVLRGDFADLPAGTGPASPAPLNEGAKMALPSLPATSLRVERSTAPALNERIRSLTDAEVLRLENADEHELARRLAELDHEWDVERLLQVNASVLVLLGVALGASRDRRFLAMPAVVFTFLAQHALQGWCPPIPVFRGLGVRTHREIARERFAIKALRGDFDAAPKADVSVSHRVHDILKAVDT